MRALTDTQILLWALMAPDRLGIASRALLESPDHEIFFSAANIWEIAIKRALERPDFDVEPDAVYRAALDTGFRELAVSSVHAGAVRHLPAHHRDPFDRLLIAQAQSEPMRLITADPVFARYGVELFSA